MKSTIIFVVGFHSKYNDMYIHMDDTGVNISLMVSQHWFRYPVMAWCRQATSHYLNQCWPRSPTLYGATRPRQVIPFRAVWSFRVNFMHLLFLSFIDTVYFALSILFLMMNRSGIIWFYYIRHRAIILNYADISLISFKVTNRSKRHTRAHIYRKEKQLAATCPVENQHCSYNLTPIGEGICRYYVFCKQRICEPCPDSMINASYERIASWSVTLWQLWIGAPESKRHISIPTAVASMLTNQSRPVRHKRFVPAVWYRTPTKTAIDSEH